MFVSGAVLGVNCSYPPLPFFPDIYNEDWFFFAEAAAHQRLAKVGEARQAEYDPYLRPTRAGHEEFGDLLAEGLYAVLPNMMLQARSRRAHEFVRQVAALATERYWSSFIDVRRQEIRETQARLLDLTLRDTCGVDVPAALRSLHAAEARYEDAADPITQTACVEFLEAWCDDVSLWRSFYPHVKRLATVRDAMDWLQIEQWLAVR